jgi:putative SOS response-associated peptidase YedK
MPVIVMPEDFARWIDPEEQGADRLKELLRPLADDFMVSHAVSKLVNNPRNERPECIARIA